ncbi:MAG: NADPH-dependent F420 reductase, partial [Candidatus Dormiibacterota bacterium]
MNVADLDRVGLIGGTGPLGRGLAARLAAAGLAVRLG